MRIICTPPFIARSEPDVGVVDNSGIAVWFDATDIPAVAFGGLADRRAGTFVPTDHFLLKVDP